MSIRKLNAMCLLIVAGLFIQADFQGEGYSVGDYATDFNLKGVDGKTVSLSDYKNAKGFVVIFTCNTCPYAKKYEERIIDLHEKYKSKGFPVIAINPNDPQKQPGDSFSAMKKRAQEKGFPFPYLVDENQDIAKKYGATRTPHVYVLDKKNDQYKVAYIGAIDDNYSDPSSVNQKYVEKAIDQLLAGQKVEVESTKAIGCTIKWKS